MYIEKAKSIFEHAYTKIKGLFAKKASVKIGGKMHTVYPVKTAVVLAAMIVIVSVILSLFSNIGGANKAEVEFELGDEYITAPIKDGVLMYNNRGAKAINADGEAEWEIKETLSEPVAESAGDYVLLSDLAGNHFAASYKGGKLQQKFSIENDIISAKITKSGFSVFATDTDGYKGRVVVYNKNAKEIYHWNSGSGYITDVEITDNGRYLAVAQLISDGDIADAKIQIMDTRRGETVAVLDRSAEVVVNMKFVSGSKLIAVTDKNILGYNIHGEEKFAVSLVGKSPSLYNIDSDDTIAVVVQGSRGNSALELYSASGKLRGEYTASGDIRALSVSGKEAVVAQQKGITRVSARGKEKKVVNTTHDIKSLGFFKGGERVLVIGSAQAEVIRVK